MESSSIVSKARTAIHSAAAKAERVFTDVKKSDLSATDRDSDKQSPPGLALPDSPNNEGESKSYHEAKNLRWRTKPIKTKKDWQERLKNIRIGKRGVEAFEKAEEKSTMSFAIFDENLYLGLSSPTSKGSGGGLPAEGSNGTSTEIIPPTAVIKQLAVALEAGKNIKSMKDLLASPKDSSPVREKAGLSFSTMKSLVLREEKFASEFGSDEKVLSLLKSLLNAEGHFPGSKSGSGSETITNTASLAKEIHGAPPESFVVKLSEAIGRLKTLRKMASLWCRVLVELRRLWSEGQYIPGIPPDEIPDLNSCLLYQQLQVINCCVSRKRRRDVVTESLDSVIRQTSSSVEESDASELPETAILYAKINTGELVVRLGADKPFDSVTMLDTGEPVYTPVMQEGPLLTEDLIKENEEFVLRTGSVGAGCSQLLSDMQAFKAANPGCILEDFVRWHSPPDWMESETSSKATETLDGGDLTSARGQLSSRMQKEGNLWRELWETSKPVPAFKQAPLFDEDLAVEGILHVLEEIPPFKLLEQLFISLLGSAFINAEVSLSSNSSLSKLFYECKDYIVAACQGSRWIEKVDDICQVYETVETMLINPDEVLKYTKQPEESTPPGEQKGRLKRLSLIFGGKDRQSAKTTPKDLKISDDNSTRQSFSSVFSKKPPKPGNASPRSVENDSTAV